MADNSGAIQKLLGPLQKSTKTTAKKQNHQTAAADQAEVRNPKSERWPKGTKHILNCQSTSQVHEDV
eukprot:2159528-Amphidinium_carterae.1